MVCFYFQHPFGKYSFVYCSLLENMRYVRQESLFLYFGFKILKLWLSSQCWRSGRWGASLHFRSWCKVGLALFLTTNNSACWFSFVLVIRTIYAKEYPSNFFFYRKGKKYRLSKNISCIFHYIYLPFCV